MRIISKFRDYYDNGAVYGVDPNVVFERKQEIVDRTHPLRKQIQELFLFHHSDYKISYVIPKGEVGSGRTTEYTKYTKRHVRINVAGMEYLGVCVRDGSSPHFLSSGSMLEKPRYFWKAEEYNDWLKTVMPEGSHEPHFTAVRHVFWQRESTNAVRDFMLDNKIVILTPCEHEDRYYEDECAINCSKLSHYGIQKLVNATEMFSLIDQFVSLMNDTSRNMVEIADKDKLEKHGMDKTSFRKMSSK